MAKDSGGGAFREIDGHPVFIKGAEPIPGHQPPWKRDGAAHSSGSGSGTIRPTGVSGTGQLMPRVAAGEALSRLGKMQGGAEVGVPFPTVGREPLMPAGHSWSGVLEAAKSAPSIAVRVDSVVGTLSSVERTTVTKYIRGQGKKEDAVGLRLDGKVYVMDGHHRIAAAVLRGDSHVNMRVVDAPHGTIAPGKAKTPKLPF